MADKRFRLGKRSAVFDSRTLLLGKYLKKGLASPPAEIDWAKDILSWPMYRNNEYADCACAAAGYLIESWTTAAGHQRRPTEQQVIELYEHFTSPGPDNGCQLLEVLKYWRKTGLAGDKIRAFAQLEPRNVNEVKDSVAYFGGCYIGVELPKFALDASNMIAEPWVVPPRGPVGNAAPGQDAGHCVAAVGYDSRNLYVVTWGVLKPMSWQFYVDYSDEAYAVLSNDFLTDRKTRAGLDLEQLERDLAVIEKVSAAEAAITRRRSV
jgi:hypothetical protein